LTQKQIVSIDLKVYSAHR